MSEDLYTFAVETSCDDTSVAIMKNGTEIVGIKSRSQIPIHDKYGGVVPEIASRNHVVDINLLTEELFAQTNMSVNNVDFISVTNSPGLIGSLLVGVSYAKSLAYAADKPLIAVNHLRGHICANYITHRDLKPPFVALVVSGGHSNIVRVGGYTSYTLLGKSTDDAAGEAYDKVSRFLNLGYPGGMKIQALAEKGNPDAYKLPIAHTHTGEFDYSFSGIKSAVLNLVNSYRMKHLDIDIPDLCASFQKAVNTALISNLIACCKKYSYKQIVLAGGVSANKNLRSLIQSAGNDIGAKVYYPDTALCGDNAAMIGCAGYFQYIAGDRADIYLNAYSHKNII